MGNYFMDQYSYLHFASGIICFFWGISFKTLLILHILFEMIENSKYGMDFINNVFVLWPGGKTKADTVINQIGDIIFSLIGWVTAYYIDMLAKRYKLNEGYVKEKSIKS